MGKIKLKVPAFRMRPNENVLSWKFMMNLPGLNQNNAVQVGSLYDMLGCVDDNDLDMSPLKSWMDMMDLSFKEIYCILLYLYFILSTELPAAPYPFTGMQKEQKKKVQNAQKVADKQNQNKGKQQNNQNKQKKPKGKKNKKKWETMTDLF